jgi:trimeric autotransporter adhesin
MKKIKHSAILSFIFFIAALGATAQNVGIGITTPDASAVLDVTASNKGLLIPRVALTSLTDAVTIPAPANSLLVYNTNAAVPGGVGFYYNSGKGSAIWVKLLSGAGGGSGWGLTGNAATDSTANFLGTTDLKPLVFRVNNGFAGQISSIGGISLGRAANGTTRIANPNVIAIGDSALFSNLNNSEVAIGNAALFSNTTGTANTAIGNISLSSNVQGSGNTAVGELTLIFNDSSNNTALGYQALFQTQEEQNTAVGAFAISDNSFGFYNSALGYAALTSNTNGFANTALGRAALPNNTSGIFNTAGGFFSQLNTTTGNHNTSYGSYSLRTTTTGSFNTAIGDSADVSGFNAGAFFNTTALGYRATVTASNTISIGNTAVTSIKGQVGFTTFSDGRYKKDVNEDIKGLDFIMMLRPVSYHYDFNKIRTEQYNNMALGNQMNNKTIAYKGIRNSFNGKKVETVGLGSLSADFTKLNRTVKGTNVNPDLSRYYEEVKQNDQIRYTGFIAQEVEAAAKKIGFEFSGVDKPKNDKDQYGLRYAEFVVPLVKAVQEQQAIIDSQNKKIDALLKRIETLEAVKK